MFSKLKNILSKTRVSLAIGWAKLSGKALIDEETLEALEIQLLKADIGINTTTFLLAQVKKRANEGLDILTLLKDELLKLLQPCEKALNVNIDAKPCVMIMIGINGAGKTTSIAKLAHYFKNQKKSVLLACGDTFRAAAIEQLTAWARRLDVPFLAQTQGSDSASVIFDALQSAKSKNIDILLADTAGRLHTKGNLMDELKKIIRVIKKVDGTAPHEVILVLDASTGQNALQQLKEFHQAVNVTGLILTKLDGTAKGGVVFALAKEFNLPIYFIGCGEQADDLVPYSATEFVQGLFEETP
jgi:fused signal recognition particle receptor